MHFILDSQTQDKIKVSFVDVCKQLLDKAQTLDKPEIEYIVSYLAESAESAGMLKKASPIQMIALGFSIGYLYRIFLQNNKVTLCLTES